ncbi:MULTISPECIES: metallophosphoesterase family protein [unclassified Streptomyces]|uniref:metallophosphoesterase family protein n=1 Tax=unclassified Streptomyces TaxID=2593676 RepID=UPI004040EF36
MSRRHLLAVSDLHVRHRENRKVVEKLAPESPRDWLLVAGDVGDHVEDIAWALTLLAGRFEKVVWAPGNHELWTPSDDPVQLRGEARYRYLVELCRGLGISTPEDEYPVWESAVGPVVIAPLFVLYDYSFLPAGARDAREARALAERAWVVCSDEFLLHPEPYPSRSAWCRARITATEARLARVDDSLPTVLVNHFPLVRAPVRALSRQEFAPWCGTEATADWPRRFRAAAVVHGHLHIPGVLRVNGVPHHEVSLGYPREWRPRPAPPERPALVLAGPDG